MSDGSAQRHYDRQRPHATSPSSIFDEVNVSSSCYLIYTANHGKRDGIEDYITLFKKVLQDSGAEVITSNELRPDATNIIIDEFTNAFENFRIAKFHKNHPDACLIYVLTEFWERKYGVESLNNFGGILDSACIAAFNVFLRLTREDFPGVRPKDIALLALYSPLVIGYLGLFAIRFGAQPFFRGKWKNLPGPLVGTFLERHHRLIYMHMRYLGLQAHLRFAKAVIASHEAIVPGFPGAPGVPENAMLQNLGVVYPEIDELSVLDSIMRRKKLFVEITGSVTPYRHKWMRMLNRYITLLGIKKTFGLTLALPFSQIESDPAIKRGAYSLHPPQTKGWRYCSPTRIFRALQIDHNLPVLTKHFHQNPIEDVCLILEGQKTVIQMTNMYFDRNELIQFVAPRIRRYNEIARDRNAVLARLMMALRDDSTSQLSGSLKASSRGGAA